MDKLLLNGVGTLGSVDSTYIVGLISFIIIGVSLLIILYRIQKWIIKVNENMSYLREVLQTYKQQGRMEKKQRIIKQILLHQTLKTLRQKTLMLKIKLQPYTINTSIKWKKYYQTLWTLIGIQLLVMYVYLSFLQ